ncbi:MAG: LemA family protein [Desulfovibrio sp.]|nr:LemA family protein [Desulfovibrio sp.]
MSLMLQLGLVATVMLLMAIIVAILYNTLMRLQTLKEEAMSGIDIQLKRRRDRIRDLVACAESAMGQEEKLLEEVRHCLGKVDKPMLTDNAMQLTTAESDLTQSVQKLLKSLKAKSQRTGHRHWLELEKSLSQCDEDLEKARRYYNGCVRELNCKLDSFPWIVVAQAFQMKRGEYQNSGQQRSEHDAS